MGDELGGMRTSRAGLGWIRVGIGWLEIGNGGGDGQRGGRRGVGASEGHRATRWELGRTSFEGLHCDEQDGLERCVRFSPPFCALCDLFIGGRVWWLDGGVVQAADEDANPSVRFWRGLGRTLASAWCKR